MAFPARRVLVGVFAVVLSQALVVNVASEAAPAAGATAAQAATCKRPARGFVPNRVAIPAFDRTLRVIQVGRTRDNAVGAGPVTDEGKWLMSMDPYTLPASRRGTVILSGHTWPDGSALGNAMLRSLEVGDRVRLAGTDGKRACYRIGQRISYPVGDVPYRKAFRSDGRERLVIVTCSGTRLGPGNWTHRTLWYAAPVVPRRPTPTPPPNPDPPSDDSPSGVGGLLGGLLGGG